MEPHWLSATDLAKAISSGEITSSEILEIFIQRIEGLDGPINSIVQLDLDRARAQAALADQAVAAGETLGRFHGVPFSVKDTYLTKGCVTTSGAEVFKDFVPESDAACVAKMRAAGAIPFAKTNVPIWANDIQTHNDIYGVTNNPWDTDRSPAGSSGGAAAALAMGFTPFEIGSDLAGSIRLPAHSCGVMGHKPSFGIVDKAGHLGTNPEALAVSGLSVSGPMARSVADLRAALEVMAGPSAWDSAAWSLNLAPSRCAELSEFRIAAWTNDAACHVEPSTTAALDSLCDQLSHGGAKVDHEARPSVSLGHIRDIFGQLLMASISGLYPPEMIGAMAADDGNSVGAVSGRSMAMRHHHWLSLDEAQAQVRLAFHQFFQDHDALLIPVQPTAAIAHNIDLEWQDRVVTIDGQQRPYVDLFGWSSLATLANLPATVVPVGFDLDGLPIGVQIVGPYLGDMTTLRLAEFVSEITGEFEHPPAAL